MYFFIKNKNTLLGSEVAFLRIYTKEILYLHYRIESYRKVDLAGVIKYYGFRTSLHC